MGGFYLDIIKDRLYTTKSDSNARRSAQTALYHIAEAFTRWITPILSYTADELWDALPHVESREKTVFASQWYQFPQISKTNEDLDASYWQLIADVKDAVNKVIETKRNEGVVGKALSASVSLYCQGELARQLNRLENELRFVLITSNAHVVEGMAPINSVGTDVDGLAVLVEPSEDAKCVRCWHQCADVGNVPAHEELCGRCVENVDGNGEVRYFA
jgi:isoleucyl-tRNA synthetase